MPKHPPTTRRVDLYLPGDIATRVEALLHSETLGRIPHGALNTFVVNRLREFFAMKRIPLGMHEGFLPGDWVVAGPGASGRVVAALEHLRHAPEGLDAAFPELVPGQGEGQDLDEGEQ